MSPKSQRDNLGALVTRIARQWRRAVDRAVQPFDLSEATWLPLLHLYRAEAPMRQKDLAASLGVDNSAVVRLLDALESAGLATRRDDPADRRAKVIVLTKSGETTVAKVEAVASQLRRRLLADISERDLDIATRVLETIGARLAAEMGDAAP